MSTTVAISPAERRVLDYLKQLGTADIETIAHSLRVTAMAVRHHLAVLDKAGLVETSLERRGVGRPHHLYSLSPAAEDFFPKGYGELASNLIRTIAHLDGHSKVTHLFKRMKQDAVARYAPRMARKPLRERVAEMAKIMSESGYMADWKQLDARTFQIVEHNCAISCVAHDYHQACDCELAMLQQLLGAPVWREEHIVAGDPCCRYLIRARRLPQAAQRRKRSLSRAGAV